MNPATLFHSVFSYRSRSQLFGGAGLTARLALDFFTNRKLPDRPGAFPRLLQIEPTAECNSHCTMCIRNSGARNRGHMSLETFRKIIQHNFPYRHWTLLYGQGEPFLNPDLAAMISWECARGNFVTVATNGTLLDQDTCENIIASRLPSLRISLDASTEKTYSRVGRGEDLSHTLDNLARFERVSRKHGRGPALSLSFMAMPENLSDLPGFVRLASRHKVKTVEVKEVPPYLDSPRPSLSVEVLKNGHIRREVDSIFRAVRASCHNEGIHVILPPLKPNPRKICLNPWFKTFITWDGLITPCSRYFSPDNYFCGNILEQPFREIWHNERYRKFRRSMRSRTPGPEMQSCLLKNESGE